MVMTSEFSILATDSKGTWTSGNSGEKSTEEIVKIVKAGEYYYSIAGILGSTKNHYGYREVISHYLVNNDFETAKSNIKNELYDRLMVDIVDYKENNPHIYDHVKDFAYFLSLGIIGRIDGCPFGSKILFQNDKKANVSITVSDSFFSSPKNSSQAKAYYLGSCDAILNYTNSYGFPKMSPEEGIVALIEAQVDASPNDCGLPVDLIKLTSLDDIWVSRKNGCPIEY
tara:strand:+ start:8304 stop:8984 length:681 start_codon:yes stop_codon:yes gene_type:complete